MLGNSDQRNTDFTVVLTFFVPNLVRVWNLGVLGFWPAVIALASVRHAEAPASPGVLLEAESQSAGRSTAVEKHR